MQCFKQFIFTMTSIGYLFIFRGSRKTNTSVHYDELLCFSPEVYNFVCGDRRDRICRQRLRRSGSQDIKEVKSIDSSDLRKARETISLEMSLVLANTRIRKNRIETQKKKQKLQGTKFYQRKWHRSLATGVYLVGKAEVGSAFTN